ncbi:hypothetical protein ACLMJK_003498 [Lecanora helva]
MARNEMAINLDPALFERKHWNDQDGTSMSKFQTFCGLFLRNIREYGDEISRNELDAFVKLVLDPALLPHGYHQITWLREDLEMDSVSANPAIGYLLERTQNLPDLGPK